MKKSAAGFTLLEIVIAVSIMAFVSIFTARMIQQGLQARSKIQGQIDRSGTLHSALQLMTRDIEMAFNYRDFNVELYNEAQKQRRKRQAKPPPPGTPPGTPGSPPPPPPPPPPGGVTPTDNDALAKEFPYKENKVYTRFLGDEEKLNFTSLNNFRAARNIKQSDQAEIGYYLENCNSRIKKDSSSRCLWRRTASIIDDDVSEGGKAQVLIENVKELKFRYIGQGSDDEWVNTWKSDGSLNDRDGRFPTAVEISLTIYDRRTDPPKEIAMTVVAALRFPNNKPSEKSGEVN